MFRTTGTVPSQGRFRNDMECKNLYVIDILLCARNYEGGINLCAKGSRSCVCRRVFPLIFFLKLSKKSFLHEVEQEKMALQ